jgi:hypothetical protein
MESYKVNKEISSLRDFFEINIPYQNAAPDGAIPTGLFEISILCNDFIFTEEQTIYIWVTKRRVLCRMITKK